MYVRFICRLKIGDTRPTHLFAGAFSARPSRLSLACLIAFAFFFAFFLRGSPSAQAQAPADSAQFISQTAPPAELQAGQPYPVTVTMKNTGTTTWTTGPQPANAQPSGYMLVSMNPTGGDIWNTVPGIQNPNNSVPISATVPAGSGLPASVAPGQTATFTFTAYAPSGGPGSFNFQWQMMHNFVRFFGDLTPNVVCSVLTDNAAFVSQVAPPSTMVAGQSYPVSVTMQNTGASTWQDGTCQILSENLRGNQFLTPSNTQPVVGTVTPGGSTTVSFNVVAPTPGSYNFQWTMSRKNIHEFGQFSTNVPVTVVAASAPPVPFKITSINNGDTLSGDVTVTVAILNGNLNGSQISLTVDGVTVDAGDVQVQSDGSYAETMVVETNDSSNGIHTIAAVDGLGNSDARSVTFNNAVTNIVYDPIFDETSNAGGVSQTSHFSATLATPQAWQIAIQDYNGNVVRSYSGSGSSIAATWDGKDSQGNDVSPSSYDLVVTTTPLGSGAITPNAAGVAIHRPIAKDSIGDSLILIDRNAIVGGAATSTAYANFINGLVASKTGVDFTTKPIAMLTTGAAVAAYPALRNRINYRFQIPCSLIYVYAHGSAVVKPRFQLGGWFWYPSLPLIPESGVPLNQRFDVSSFTSMAGYDEGNDPPRLVWIDTCDSSGINSLSPDNSWGDCFSVDQGGAYVGWAGPIGLYGWPQSSIFSCFTNWRNAFWYNLFQNNQNVQTALANANKTPGQYFGPNQNPSGLVTLYGFGSASF